MYPMSMPQMAPYAPGASFLSRGMLHGGVGHLNHLPLQQGVVGQTGGFLSKLFGGANAGGGGITNIMNMLQSAQKAISTFQRVGPMVQQYAPLVKSLPSLINVMRGSSNTNDENTGADNKKVVEKTKIKEHGIKKSSNKGSNKLESSTKARSKNKATTKKSHRKKTNQKQTNKYSINEIPKGIPAPKLYI